MPNNLDFALKHLNEHLTQPGDFFPLVILKRKKENPDMDRGVQVIKHINVYHAEQLEISFPTLQLVCEQERARLYMRCNKRSDPEISTAMVRYVVDKHLNREFSTMGNAYTHVVGITPAKGPKQCMIDVDQGDSLEDAIKALRLASHGKQVVEFQQVPSVSGVHVITPAFDVKLFAEHCKCMTSNDGDFIVYCPNI